MIETIPELKLSDCSTKICRLFLTTKLFFISPNVIYTFMRYLKTFENLNKVKSIINEIY